MSGEAKRQGVDRWVSLPHVDEIAKNDLHPDVYQFIAAGAADENTVRWNREAFDRIRLRPRLLEDPSDVSTRTVLFGHELDSPIILAPTAYHRMLHPEGELATAAGAGAAGVPWVVSSSTTTSIEQIAQASTTPLWFQLYLQADRGFVRDLVGRAQDAGFQALCLTVDTPVLGARDRQRRIAFTLPPGMLTPHLQDTGSGGRDVMATRRTVVTWRDVEWLRSISSIPLVLKGVLDPSEAERGLASGANAIIVSNHGGRNLDTLPATIDALRPVVDQIMGRVPVLMDGGIRRGTDILKAMAYGAAAVLIGRPYCYGLALAGAAGVARVVQLLGDELRMALILTGRPSLSLVTPDVVW